MLFLIVISAFLYDSVDGSCVQTNGATCPMSCECYEGVVKCISLELNKVPYNLPNNLHTLDLSRNRIHSIEMSDFEGCTRLKAIDLSANGLLSVDKVVFKNTPILQNLSLAQNLLQHVDFDSSPLVALKTLDLSRNFLAVSKLPWNTFRGLRSLEVLDLTINLSEDDPHYNEDLLIPLNSLKILRIDGVRNENFPEGFAQLTHLEELSIRDGINLITNETFAVFKTINLTKLCIRADDSLITIEPYSFAHFKRLKSLDLSKNDHLTLKGVSNAWYGLQLTQIEELRLNQLTPGSHITEELDDTFFKYLDSTEITWLELKRNKLSYIKPVFSKILPKLKHLDLTSNQLYNSISLIDDLANLTYLQELWIGDQICPPWRDESQSTKLVKRRLESLDDNYLFGFSDFETALRCWTNIVTKCQQLIDRRDLLTPVCISLSASVVEINLFGSLNVNNHKLPFLNITSGGGNLQKINLGGNGLHKFSEPIIFRNPPKTLVVDLSNNQMTCLHPELFKISDLKDNVKVIELILSENNLGNQLQLDVNGSTFNHYRSLAVLDLKANWIRFLNAKAFRDLTELQTLLLNRNLLRSVDFEFMHLVKLSRLDLSYNDILSLNSSLMQAFTGIFSKNYSRLKLNLNGNPIQCSCDSLTFLHWMNLHRYNLDDFEKISCFFLGERVNFTRLQNYILVELDYLCWNSVAVIVSGTLLGLVIVIFAASAFCYRHRWEIRYGCIRLTQKGQRYQRLVNEDVTYTYDAFVVYDSGDRTWVNDVLLPRLENGFETDNQSGSAELQQFSQQLTQNLRLCVHERDFLPGEDILGNIWSKMEKSRKVILILSKNFTLSHYCEYEMNLARMQSVEQGRNVIVPIVLEMPEMDKVSDCLSWLMRKVTYIEWPQYEGDRDEFWNKLYETLVDRE